MASDEYHQWRPARSHSYNLDLNAPLPDLPQASSSTSKPLPPDPYSYYAHSPFQHNDPRSGPNQATHAGHYGPNQDPFSDDAAIPMQSHYHDATAYFPEHQTFAEPPPLPTGASFEPLGTPRSKNRRFLSWRTPWVTYILTLIQISVFIYELIHNATLTGSPIEIHPSFNPMIGPSPYVLINIGGRYIPCMRAEAGVQDASTIIYWPCPNQTDLNPSCTLSELCGFSGVPNPVVGGSLDATPAPNQWFRFITPIFIHAGIVHIGFNMMLQILLGGDMETAIGHVRFTLVYFTSGIFGFVMGGNFAASGIVSTGASGSLFGIIALLLLDLLYTWSTRRSPFRDLIFLLLDICISFVLGLLPGLDNFSHIGGFLMGLVLGVCLLRSPDALRRERGANSGRGAIGMIDDSPRLAGNHGDDGAANGTASDTRSDRRLTRKRATSQAEPLTRSSSQSPEPNRQSRRSNLDRRLSPAYIAFTLLRAAALAAAVTCSVLLIRAFYAHHSTECSWCKYLSCLPIKDWCDVGQLTFTNSTGH